MCSPYHYAVSPQGAFQKLFPEETRFLSDSDQTMTVMVGCTATCPGKTSYCACAIRDDKFFNCFEADISIKSLGAKL